MPKDAPLNGLIEAAQTKYRNTAMRREAIRRLMGANGFARVSYGQLMETFGVSKPTIWRDLKTLDKEILPETVELLGVRFLTTYDRCERALNEAIDEAKAQRDPKARVAAVARLMDLPEKVTDTLVRLGAMKDHAPPTGAAFFAQVTTRNVDMKFIAAVVPGMTREQQLKLIEEAHKKAGSALFKQGEN